MIKQILTSIFFVLGCMQINAQQQSLVINEILAINDSLSSVVDPLGDHDDFIEIYNNTNADINLTGYYLSDNDTLPIKWQFPAGVSIAANGYLLVWADKEETEAGVHANFKLNGSGESVTLSNPNLQVLDAVAYGQQTNNVSHARIPNGTGPFVQATPTPNAMNEALAANDFFKSIALKLFPNPANDVVNISIEELPLAADGLQISLISALGQTMASQTLPSTADQRYQTHFDTKKLPTGAYYILVVADKHSILLPLQKH